MFAICGAQGDISITPGGQPVIYDDTLLEDDARLYYTPLGDCHFVDYEVLNDKITTSSTRARQNRFRQDLVDRDGCCIVTGDPAYLSQAVHLIPHSKGDEYINKVTQDHSSLYLPPLLISDIDAVENGVLLRSELHIKFARGEIAFLKTPNYGLETFHIPRLHPHVIHGNHSITLHQLRPTRILNGPHHDRAMANQAGAHTDVQFLGRDQSLPPPPDIILDYMYGVAAYKLWRSNPQGVHNVMSTYHSDQYTGIPLLSPQSPSAACETTTEVAEDPFGRDYVPSLSEDEMSQAMDDLNLALMCISGITPQELADQRKKQAEEKEQVAQKISQRRVAEWMSHGTSLQTETGLSSNAAYTLSSYIYPPLSNTANRDLSSNAADTDLSSNAAYHQG